MQPYQLKIRGKLEVLQLLEHDIVGTVAEGVGDYCNAKSLGHKLQQGVQSLRLLNNTHGETCSDTFLAYGINPFGPELA